MKPNALLRTATLSLFIMLMSGFVAYKAGAFEGGESAVEVNIDSPKKDSALPAVMAPSSKSSILFEPESSTDSSLPHQQQQQRNQNSNAPVNANQNAAPAPKPNVYMGSSKSAPVFTPPVQDTSHPK